MHCWGGKEGAWTERSVQDVRGATVGRGVVIFPGKIRKRRRGGVSAGRTMGWEPR